MPVMSVTREVRTHGNGECHDITSVVAKAVEESGLEAGVATVFVTGSTAAVTTIEFEPGLAADFPAMFERLIPRALSYRHHERWGDDNGHSHVRASLLGPSLGVPFTGGALLLGTWQQIILIDFDTRPRGRQYVVQIVGE